MDIFNNKQKSPSDSPLKRTRAKRSCDFCRKRKSRCDADTCLPCSNCKAWGYTCEFQTIRKKRGPPSVYVDNLEKKCRKMESLLSALTKLSIKDLERNDFQYAGYTSSNDEEEDTEKEIGKDVDCIRYTGPSSVGIGLLDLDVFTDQSSIPWPGKENVYLQLSTDNELMIVTHTSDIRLHVGLSMGAPSVHVTQPSVLSMPVFTHTQFDKVVQFYFRMIHPLYPLINKDDFLSQYHQDIHDQHPSSLLLHSVYAVTFRFIHQHKLLPLTHADTAGAFYFKRVMKRLRDVTRSRLCHVQSALLMTIYLDMDEDDMDSVQWYTLGHAIRAAQELGLHRSCRTWNIPAAEVETRHRVFYCCYILDRWMAAKSGRPLILHDYDTDIPHIDQYTRPFVMMIQLSEILGTILQTVYSRQATTDSSTVTHLSRRLTNWRATLDETMNGYPLSELDKLHLEIYYNAVVLVLHRAFYRLSVDKYNHLKSVISESDRICNDTAKILFQLNTRRQYYSFDPYFHTVFLCPSFYVYSLFQSSLVYLSIAQRSRTPMDIQTLHQSIDLIKHKGIGSRAVETLKMLCIVNRLNPKKYYNQDKPQFVNNTMVYGQNIPSRNMPVYTHHRSISLDQPSHTPVYYTHTRSISLDHINTLSSNDIFPCYSPTPQDMIPSDELLHTNNNINWNDWDVYLGPHPVPSINTSSSTNTTSTTINQYTPL